MIKNNYKLRTKKGRLTNPYNIKYTWSENLFVQLLWDETPRVQYRLTSTVRIQYRVLYGYMIQARVDNDYKPCLVVADRSHKCQC